MKIIRSWAQRKMPFDDRLIAATGFEDEGYEIIDG